MAKEIEVRKITVDTSEAVESMAQLDQATENVTESTADLDSQLEELPGPLGKAQQGIKAVQKGFKALLANPIVLFLAAIVAGLALLFKAFTKTEAGADKMKDVMAGVSAVLDVLTQRAAKLFKALGQIIRGNFKEGFQEMGEAVKGVGDEIREATRAAVEFERAVRRLFEAETDLITVNAERRRQIEELVFLTRDLTQTDEVRRNAIIEAAGIEEQILQDNIKLQEQRIQLQKDAIANSAEEADTREELRKLAEAEGILIDLQTASGAKQRELQNRLNEIDNAARAKRLAGINAQAAREKEIEAERVEREKTASDARKEEAEIDALFMEELANEALESERQLAEQQKAINDELTASIIANAEKELVATIQAEQDKVAARQGAVNATNAILGDGFAALGGFLKEGAKTAKAIQIADGTRAAIMGAIQTFQATAAIPIVGPVLAPIAAGAALAAGMANVRKMANVSGPLGGGGSVPSVSLARPSAGVDSRNLVNADQAIPTDVQITQDSSQRGPTKTYVVQSDVSAAQDIEKQRQHDATL